MAVTWVKEGAGSLKVRTVYFSPLLQVILHDTTGPIQQVALLTFHASLRRVIETEEEESGRVFPSG